MTKESAITERHVVDQVGSISRFFDSMNSYKHGKCRDVVNGITNLYLFC